MFGKITLKDRFDHIHNRSLDQPVPDRGDTQWAGLRCSRFWDVNTPNRLGPVCSAFQSIRQLPEILRNLSQKLFRRNMVDASSTFLLNDLLGRG